jgi:PAS domain S-box-containing protein
MLQIDPTLQIALLICGIGLLGAIGTIFWTSRRLSRFLLQLNDADKATAQEDFDTPTADLAKANATLEQEIAERKQVEQALRASEGKFRAMFNQRLQLVSLLKPDGTVLEANQTALNFGDLKRSQVIGKLFWDTRWWSRSAETQAQLQQAIIQAAQGKFIRYEVEVLGRGDHIATIDFSLRPIWDEAGQVWLLLSEGQDISERKRQEAERQRAAAALETQRALLYSVIDAVPSCIFVKDPEGRITAVNQAGADLHGATVEEIVGNRETHFGHVSAAQLEEFLAINREVMASRQPQTCPAQGIRNRQGELRWYQTTISPYIDNEGQVQGIIGSATDITELKRAEEALRQAKNAAEAANKAKGAFLANMSHELRTPLNAILGFSQLMSHDALTPQQRKQLETINRNGEYLLQLINEVLSSAKIESGHISLEEAPCNLYLLLDSVEGMFSLRASSQNIKLLCDRATDVPQFIEIDSRKLRQVLTNLIDNAIKFTEQGQVILRVKIAQSAANEPRLYFEVEDSGLGIADNELNLIFESFVQSEAGRQLQQGTGLGLPLCRRFVQLMGGDLIVNSRLGQGSSFGFTLPLKLAADSTQRAIAPTAHLTYPASTTAVPLAEWTNSLDASLQTMPTEWIAAVNFAARSADAKTIFRLLEQIPEAHLDLKEAIASLVEHFNLEWLIQLTQTDRFGFKS